MLRNRLAARMAAVAVGAALVLAQPASALASEPGRNRDKVTVVETVISHDGFYYIDGVIVDASAVETYRSDGTAEASSIPLASGATAGLRLASNRKVTWKDLQRWVESPGQEAPMGSGRLLTRAEKDRMLTQAARTLTGSDDAASGAAPMGAHARLAPAPATAFTVTQDMCVDESFSDNDVHIRACTQQSKGGNYLANGRRHFLLNRKGLATGWSTDDGCLDCDRITGVGTYAWSDNFDRPAHLDWSPFGQVPVSTSCRQVTVSSTATVGGVTAGNSQTSTVCPDNIDVYLGGNPIAYYMGSQWSGADVAKDSTRGTIWSAVARWTPDNQAGDHLGLAVHGHMWWN